MLYRDSYEDAWQRGYRDLTPANLYNVDYSLLGTARVEPLLRRIRNEMAGAGLIPESAKGECNLGQHEIAFRYADALDLRRQPRHLQERRQGDRRPGGHGAHLHGQAQRARGQLLPHPLLAARRRTGGRRCSATARPTCRETGQRVLAGLLATMREFSAAVRAEHQLLQAVPAGLVRADRAALGRRQPHLRAAGGRARAGHAGGEPGAGRRRQPVPGDRRRWSPGRCTASRTSWSWRTSSPATRTTTPSAPRVPAHAARRAGAVGGLGGGRAAAFGDEVVAHYANNARVELAAFDAAVTDWELLRGFERL